MGRRLATQRAVRGQQDDDGEAEDDEGRLAQRVAGVARRLDLRRVARLGIRVVDWKVGSPLAPLVRRALQPVRGHAG